MLGSLLTLYLGIHNESLSNTKLLTITRHGWGIVKDEAKAVTYLSYAASNSADIESLALQAGMKKGGAAKGELTLAIFELANCFRNGWGVKKDPVAAKQYYETAANMGDTDGLNEVAWCYLEGFGCKKDKVRLRCVLLDCCSVLGSLPRRPSRSHRQYSEGLIWWNALEASSGE